MNIPTKWVAASYTGDRAKSVLAHANEGIGYKILQQSGRGTTLQVLAAFLAPEPLPAHVTEIVDPIKIAKLEGRL